MSTSLPIQETTGVTGEVAFRENPGNLRRKKDPPLALQVSVLPRMEGVPGFIVNGLFPVDASPFEAGNISTLSKNKFPAPGPESGA